MRLCLGLWAIVVAAACGTPMSFTPTADASRPTQPRGPVQVDVFTTGRPARPHVEVGIIESGQDSSTDHARSGTVDEMREYAAEQGCDALVIPAGEATTATTATTAHSLRGSCLVYTSPPLMQPPPTAAASTAPSTTCIPSAPQPCYGAGGCRGSQVCGGDGKSFSACDCSASGSP